MRGFRCQSCGLVNFSADAPCRRCGGPVVEVDLTSAPQSWQTSPYAMPVAPQAAAQGGIPVWAKVLIGLLVIVVLTTGVVTSIWMMKRFSPSWRAFKSPDGSFVVSMPATPYRQEYMQQTDSGPVPTVVYSATMLNGDEFMVMHSEFTLDELMYANEQAILDGACEGIEGSGYAIISKTPTTVQGHPAYELLLRVPQSIGRGPTIAAHHVIWSTPRLYQVSFATRDVASTETDGKRFFDSFALLK